MVSFIVYKIEKQTKSDFYETIVAISPIIGMEFLLIIMGFLENV